MGTGHLNTRYIQFHGHVMVYISTQNLAFKTHLRCAGEWGGEGCIYYRAPASKLDILPPPNSRQMTMEMP